VTAVDGGGAGSGAAGPCEAVVHAEVERRRDQMVDVRRDLHAHPELSFEEHRTTLLVRDELSAAGVVLLPSPTPTGAVGLVEGGRPGATVLLRADIDALPVEEQTGLPFRSEDDGKMHACGHDAHTAILLGVAAALASCAGDLPGRYLLVFQPAEERVSGAQAMMDGGLLQGLDPAAAVGLHVVSFTPTGTVAARPGIAMAGGWGLRVTVTGSGGHGALQPRQGNVVLAAAEIATRLHTAVDGMGADGTGAVCSPGRIFAGTAPNVVPTRAELFGTLRWFDPGQRDEAIRRVEALCAEVSEDFGVSSSVEVEFATGPVSNDPAVTATVLAAVHRALPGVEVREMPAPVAASDDMSVILDAVPGCYMMVGAAPADGSGGMHHSPTFAIDEEVLSIGAHALASSAVTLAAGTEGRPSA
jgi:amidohydrolase